MYSVKGHSDYECLRRLALISISLILSTSIHFLHLWHFPSCMLVRSFLAGFGRSIVRKATGGEKGRAETEEIP